MMKRQRLYSFLLAIAIILTSLVQIPAVVYAGRGDNGTNPGRPPTVPPVTKPPVSPPTTTPDPPGDNVTPPGDNVTPPGEDPPTDDGCCVIINIPEPNFRTMQVLDVASIMNDNVESIADYRPNLMSYLESLPDFRMADIREYLNFEDESRHKRSIVPVVDDKQKEYSHKVQTLIEQNILNRDSRYSVSTKGAYISPEDDTDGIKTIKRYEDPNKAISRTDFIVELMKTEEIEVSPPIIVRSKYSRTNNVQKLEFVETEPVEVSPYQHRMGEMGLDSGQTDVIVDYRVFGRMSVMATNDVVEPYLARAYNKGLIRMDEFDRTKSAKELVKFIEDKQPSTYAPVNALPPRWILTEEPLRKNYADRRVTGKIWEDDNMAAGQYPEKLGEWEEVRIEMEMGFHKFEPQSTLWGQAYDYGAMGRGDSYRNWFEPATFEIVRKKSVLDDTVDGYSFFKMESLTLMDAYMYTYKHMLTTEGEKTLTEAEIEYLNSSYSMNMTSMKAEEKTAVNYLLAKGIIDGDDMNLYKSIHLPLRNNMAIDILWKLNQPNERTKITPTLTELDQQMLSKGYSQASVEVKHDESPKPMAFLDPESGRSVQGTIQRGLFEVFKDYENENMATYDLIFVRQPKLAEDDSLLNLRLVINDPFRTELQAYDLKAGLGGGVLLDGFGYEWKGYMVHKDSSSDLMILGSSKNQIYTIDGISGEGFYWIPDEKPVGKASKWTVEEFLNSPAVYSYINKLPNESTIYRQMKSILQFKGANYADTSKINTNNLLAMAAEQRRQGSNNPIKDSIRLLTIGNKKELKEEELTNIYKATNDKRMKDKSEINFAMGEVLWTSPTYLDPAVPKDIIYGPLRTDELKQLKYSGDYLALAEGDGFKINMDNKDIPMKPDGTTPKVGIKSEIAGEEKLFYVHITPNTFSYDVELANFTHKLSIDAGSPGKKLPGYAQMADRHGDPFVIISKAELEEFNITPISDKILENKTTGQRAFLNTDDHYTLIGNNLTHYLPGDMLVYAYGASDDHTMETGEPDKVFYNLNIILELINDINVVAQSAGKSIQINLNPAEKYQVIQVQDAENRLEGDARTIIDQTYLLNSTETANGIKSYVNLSALGGPTSNFIYYKDRATTTSVEALIVYKPKAIYSIYVKETLNTLRAQMGKSGGSEKEEIRTALKDIAFTTGLSGAERSEREKELEILKNQIMSKLFIGVQEDQAFIGEDYVYNIYILAKDHSEAGMRSAQDAFMARIVGTDKAVWDKVKEYTTLAPGSQIPGSAGEQDLTISVLPVGISPTQQTDLLEHNATGNLYMYMGNSVKGGVSAQQSKQYRALFYQNMYLDTKSGADTEKYQLMFRQKHYYQNTPDNHIPLERYAEHSGSYGSMFLSGGAKMINFKTSNGSNLDQLVNHYSYRLPSNDISNNFVIKDDKSDDVGLFSHLEMPWIELKFDAPMEGLNTKNEVVEVDLTKANTEIEFTKMIYAIMAKQFQDEINKTVAPVPNVPNGVVDGDLLDPVPYNISEVMKTSAVGFAENKPEVVRNLMQGTWDAVLPERIDHSQFNIYNSMAVEGLTVPLTNTDESGEELDGGSVVLALGRNPFVSDSANKDVKEGKLMAISVTKNEEGLVGPVDYNAKTKKKIHAVSGYADLKAFAKSRKVYIKPSLGIPHGTTIVDRRGGLLMRKHPTPREEVLYSADIINSLIMRMQLGTNYEGKVFIHELDAGTVIKLGDNRYVVKTSPKQPANEGALSWVNVVTLPASEMERGGEIDKKGMNDYSMMSRFLSTWGNTVMIPYNIASASVPLKSIVGKGIYSIPTIEKLNYAINAKDGKASKHFTSEIWTKQAEDVGKTDYDVVGTTWSKSPFTLLDATYPHIKFKTRTNLKKAIPIIEIPLPPTIAVTQVKGDGLDYHYEVDMYYDIKGFNVDKDNTYVQYLRDRDTNAKDVLEGLEQLRMGNLNGMKYKEFSANQRLNRLWEDILAVASAVVPILCVMAIIILLLLYVAFRLPGIRNVLIDLSDRFGLNLASEMLYGGLTTDNLPSFVNISIACVLLATIALLFWDMTGLKVLTFVWVNIKNAFM